MDRTRRSDDGTAEDWSFAQPPVCSSPGDLHAARPLALAFLPARSCRILAHNAVHAAFSGFTGTTVGLVNTHYVYLPIPVIIQVRAGPPLPCMSHAVAACSATEHSSGLTCHRTQ
jgi:hypothetical protein